MLLSFFSFCSVPCAGIRRSGGAGTDIAVGRRGHFKIGRVAEVGEGIECGDQQSADPYSDLNGIVSIVRHAIVAVPRIDV